MKSSIHDLLLVKVIVALGAGWWVDRSRMATEIEGLKEIERLKEDECLGVTPFDRFLDEIARKAARSGT